MLFLQQCALVLHAQFPLSLQQYVFALNALLLPFLQRCVLALNALLLPYLLQCALVLHALLLPFLLQCALVLHAQFPLSLQQYVLALNALLLPALLQLARLHAAPFQQQRVPVLISLQLLAQQDELVVPDVVALPLAALELNAPLLPFLLQYALVLNVPLLPALLQLARLHAAPFQQQRVPVLISLQLLAQQDELVVPDVVALPLAALELNAPLLPFQLRYALALNVQPLPFLQQLAQLHALLFQRQRVLALISLLLLAQRDGLVVPDVVALPLAALELNVQLPLFLLQCALALSVQFPPSRLQYALALSVQLPPFRLQYAVVLLIASGYQPLLLLALFVVFLICQNQTKTRIYFFLPYLLITTYKNLINLHE